MSSVRRKQHVSAQESSGNVIVTISDLRATQLAKVSLFGGKPNPYTVAVVNGQSGETSVLKETVNPNWTSDTLTFSIEPTSTLNFEFTVYHKPRHSAEFHSKCGGTIEITENVTRRDVFHRLVNKKGSVAGTLDFKLSVEVPDSADALSPQTPLSPPLPSSSSHASDDGLPSTPPKRPPMFAMTSSKSKGSRTSLSSVASGASGFDTFSDAAPWDESPRTKNTGLLPSTSSSGSLGVSGSGSGSGTVNRKAGSIRSSPYFRGQDIVEEPTEYDLKGQETGSIFSDSTLTDSMSSPGAGPSSFPSPSSPALSRNSPLSERVRSLTTSMELRNESTSSLGDAVDSLGLLMGFFDRVAQSNLFLLVAWSALGTALRAVKSQQEQDSTILMICKQIRDMLVFARNVRDLRQLEGGMDVLGEMIQAIERAARLIDEYLQAPFRVRAAKGVFWDKMGPRISACTKELDYWHKLFDRHVNHQILSHVDYISSGVEIISERMERMESKVEEMHETGRKETRDHLKILSSLPRIHRAMFDRVKLCAKGTRTELLSDLMSWAVNPSPSAPQVCWLHGQAGMGKSTIAATFASTLKDKGCLGGDFFFSRSVAERNTTNGVFVTIAYQMATRIPGLKEAICDALEQEPDVGNLAVSTQWKVLIKGPLLQAYANGDISDNFVVVMDAFDECGAPLDILDNIESDIACLPPQFKVFCTSRPENMLEAAFRSMGGRVREFGLNATDINVTRDIRTFILERMKRIAKTYGLESEDGEWPGRERLDVLVRRAAGLFIWVTTASEFIEDEEVGDPEGQLQIVLDEIAEPSHGSSSASPWNSLDSLYLQVLRQALSDRAPEFRRKLYRQIVGAIVTIRNPLNISGLAHLLDIQPQGGNTAVKLVEQTIGKIRAVLFIPKNEDDVIRTIHKSFSDYLTERCTEERLAIDPQLQHQYLATRCLQLMDDLLTPFVCDLHPSKLNKEVDDIKERYLDNIPVALRYACNFWAEHLESAVPKAELLALVKRFYEKHLLCWLEVLSLVGLVDSAPDSAEIAYKWLDKKCKNEEALCALAKDSHRFVVEFQEPIAQSAAHVRYSALPLAPRSLPVYNTYCSQMKPDAVNITYGPPLVWPGWCTVMDGHTDSVYSVVCSPNGEQVASGSEDRNVRLWNSTTGSAIGHEFRGHKKTVTGVVFEPDGKHVISGSEDGSIRRWNLASGDPVGRPLTGHTAGVSSIALASEENTITALISGSLDGTVRSWNIQDGSAIELCRHSLAVTSVAISPDGTRFVSGSKDSTVKRWMIDSGAAIGRPLVGHTNAVCSVAYSPDGKRIVSSSIDASLRLWNATSDKAVGKLLLGHAGPVYSVAFSPDGRVIGSGSLDATVRLWNGVTGDPIGQILTQTDAVLAVAFSRDSKTIIAAIYDFTIRCWNVDESLIPDDDPVDPSAGTVLSVKFSHDGKRIVLGSTSGSVEVFDAETRQSLVNIRKAHAGPVYQACFSDDDSLIVSSSHDKTVRQWDASTGEQVRKPLEGHTNRVFCVGYSADAKRIVSCSEDQTVRVWDAISGVEIGKPSIRHYDDVYSCACSPDGSQVASGSRDKSLKIWDVESGALIKDISNETSSVTSIEYSLDGRVVLGTSIDGKGIFWNRITDSRNEVDFFTRSILYDLEGGWLKDVHGRRLCWLPSEYRSDFRPGVFDKHLLATPNVSQREKFTIFDLSQAMTRARESS